MATPMVQTQYRQSLTPSMAPRLSSYTSNGSHCSKCSTQPPIVVSDRVGISWKGSWWTWPAYAAAVSLLVGWLAAAAYLYHIQLYLPLNYWTTYKHGILGHGNYNQIIQNISGLVGACITYGIAQGFKSALLHESISPRGLSLYRLDALSKMANQSLQVKFRATAIGAFVIWALANQFGAASAAAFGTAVSTMNFTSPIQVARITDNVPYLTTLWSSGANLLPAPGDLDNIAASAFYSLAQGETAAVPFIVDGFSQLVDPNTPLLTISLASKMDLVDTTEYVTQIPSKNMDLLKGNKGANHVYSTSEGSLANVACSSFQLSGIKASTSATSGFLSVTLPFSCGTAYKQYVLGTALPVVDYYACVNGDPTIYVLTPLSETSIEIWQCTVAASTVLVGSHLQEFNGDVETIGSTFASETVTNIGGLVKYMGELYYNAFGVYGSPALSSAFAQTPLYNGTNGLPLDDNLTAVVQLTVWATILTGLSKMGFLLVNGAEMGVAGIVASPVVASYELTALQLHFSGIHAFYILLPTLLLVILVVLIFLHAIHGHGQTDLTDPVAVALIGLGSPYDGSVHGGSTGEFHNEALYHSTKLFYGAEQNQAAVGGNATHLVMSCSNVGITKPTRRTHYS